MAGDLLVRMHEQAAGLSRSLIGAIRMRSCTHPTHALPDLPAR
jgi:hypothetical protein